MIKYCVGRGDDDKQTNKNWKFQFPQPDYRPRHSPDFRTVFGIMIGPFSSCEIGKTWGLQNEKKPYVKWEKARKPLSNGRKWANYLPRYHVTNLISEQISDFCLYLTFCQFRKRKMVQSWFQKLFWNQDCDVVSNLVVEIAIYNFDIFHTALM